MNQVQAADVRDSIVKALYSGVFKAIIDQINKSIEGSTSSTRARYLSIKILVYFKFRLIIIIRKTPMLFSKCDIILETYLSSVRLDRTNSPSKYGCNEIRFNFKILVF